MLQEWHNAPHTISTDPHRLDLQAIQQLLSTAYWARNRSLATIQRSIAHSLCFGVYQGKEQVGFARVITDYATFAYLADVVIADEARGQGLGTWLIRCITEHPELQGLRRWVLVTQDAHTLYAKFGWTPLAHPERWMERFMPDAS